jgi:hypothetical protein
MEMDEMTHGENIEWEKMRAEDWILGNTNDSVGDKERGTCHETREQAVRVFGRKPR